MAVGIAGDMFGGLGAILAEDQLKVARVEKREPTELLRQF